MAEKGGEQPFADYLSTVVRHTMIGHGLALGIKVGVLKILMETDKALTCQEIAATGKLKERYVKELLAVLVCGRIVDYDKSKKTYFISADRKAAFPQKGHHGSSLHMMGILLQFTLAEPQLAECFKVDGPKGVPMSEYFGFQFHHHSHEDWTLSTELLKTVISKFPNLTEKLENGGEVLEAGCGSGILARKMAEAFPKSAISGVDISEEAVEIAKKAATEKGLTNLTHSVQDLCDLPQDMTGKFDFAFSHFVIHDVPRASVALKEICRLLKPGGVYLMVDVNMHSDVADNLDKFPDAVLNYTGSLFFAMPVSFAEEGGEGLGSTWGIELQQEYLRNAGFERVHLPVEASGRNAFVAGYKPQ